MRGRGKLSAAIQKLGRWLLDLEPIESSPGHLTTARPRTSSSNTAGEHHDESNKTTNRSVPMRGARRGPEELRRAVDVCLSWW
jgi:hypothetical protein